MPSFLLAGQSLMYFSQAKIARRLYAAFPGCSVATAAVSGTSILDWLPPKPAYRNAVGLLQALQETGVNPGAVLFFQGQSDAHSASTITADEWVDLLFSMADAMRADLGTPDLKFIFGVLGETPAPPVGAGQYTKWAALRSAQAAISKDDFVKVNQWGCGPYEQARPYCHLTESGYEVLADRFVNWTKATFKSKGK